MALRKALLAKRSLFDAAAGRVPPLTPLSIHLDQPITTTPVPPNAAKAHFCREYLTSPDSADKGFFRRFLHRRAQSQSPRLPEFLSLPVGEKLREKLKGMNLNGSDRLGGLTGLSPPPPDRVAGNDVPFHGISVSEARKILRASQVEKLKAKLREIPESSISYSDFCRICVEGCVTQEQGLEFAKMLDDSGNVIVVGNVVFLRPEQVAKSMESLITQTMGLPRDPRRRELDQLEKQKMVIDQKARALVQGELYGGLGFILLQTVAAIRLTFWELSWDVMEPICFFMTSIYFSMGYGFFLRTSTEPTFEGFFQRRFQTKQRRLMEVHNFDIQKFNQLCKVFYPNSERPSSLSFDDVETTLSGAAHR